MHKRGEEKRTAEKGKAKRLPTLRIPLVGHAATFLDTLLKTRAMTVSQLAALHVPITLDAQQVSQEEMQRHWESRLITARRVLGKLHTHGFIRRTRAPRRREETNGGQREWLYGAALPKAVDAVAEYHQRQLFKQHGDAIPEELVWKTQAESLAAGYGYSSHDKILQLQESNLKHFLREMDLFVVISLACQQQGYTLLSWRSDLQVRRLHQQAGNKVAYISPENQMLEGEVCPDGFFVLGDPESGQKERFFVEVDNGTMTEKSLLSKNEAKKKRSWQSKYRMYNSFFDQGLYRKLYGQTTGKVLVITTSARRMQRLKALCEEAGGRGRYWHTFWDLVTPEQFLTKPIFQRAGDTKWVGLFGHDA